EELGPCSVLVNLAVPAPVAPLALLRLWARRLLLLRPFPARRRVGRSTGRTAPALKTRVEPAATAGTRTRTVARPARRAEAAARRTAGTTAARGPRRTESATGAARRAAGGSSHRRPGGARRP